ncbi:YdaS family helix-turn-helix protein [Phocoenobacter skyensis]|uniref:DNA-binding transcriptional regulator, XRE-family HTH domain n=1 Tax=Phocoenobacter skyensis TaxID=97481 RepID=A0A1H7XKX4_9PAST|nr:YdaS family helix-turn-helix protein [Pasteurella skyensis]MDP8184376.1 YdaS family helix-turn-helix protein [Pasteurella skyensis]QLB22619.1 hypothetical protein A6B44_05125 [Pasteurella skyensis]SEM34303.1 DNA-binding transcriptional regulator, XRE-family HTH domain [Pasteurella skyensis]
MKRNKIIGRLIEIAGSKAELAKLIGASPVSVAAWYNCKYGVNAKYLIKLSEVSNGEFTVEDIIKSTNLYK